MRRIPQLDLLRVVAITFVIWNHFPFARSLGNGVWIGVDLFFVLSGFLISGLLFEDALAMGRIRVLRFYVRRWFKIYPPFLFFLFCLFALDPQIRHLPYWHELLFLQNYLPYVWGHTWSLAVEEHFYLLLPLLLVLLLKLQLIEKIPTVGISLAAVCLAIRLSYCLRGAWQRVPYLTHTRIDALFCGVMLGYYYHYHPQQFRKWTSKGLLVIGVLLVSPAFLLVSHPGALYSLGLTSISAGFACILVWFVNTPSARVRPLERIGAYSYSIYLWHLPIVLVLRNTVNGTLPMLLLTWLVCITVGIVMAHLVEFPMLQLRDRWTARQSQLFASEPQVAVTAGS